MTSYLTGGQLTGTAFTPIDYLISRGLYTPSSGNRTVKQSDKVARFRTESGTLNLQIRTFAGQYPSKSDLTLDQEIANFYHGFMQQQKTLYADLADILARNAKKLYVR